MPTSWEMIAIGGSAGSIEALGQLLPALPPGLPAAIGVVVHLPEGRPSLLPQIFRDRCLLPVREAEDKQPVTPGALFFAPPGYHLLVERRRTFALSLEPPVHFSRPSIDVFFASVARAYRARCLGILLTGASEDGAAGLAAIRDAGATVWVQDPATAYAPEMPRAGVARARPHAVLTPGKMAAALAALSSTGGAT